jgi:hypothetical protein
MRTYCDRSIGREKAMRTAATAVLGLVLAWPAAALAANDGETVASVEMLAGAPAARGAALRVQGDLRAACGSVLPGVFRLDATAADAVAPASALEAIGVDAEGFADYRGADGRVEQRPYGVVQVEFLGEAREMRVIFGPEDAEPALGLSALEAIGLTVDAESDTLRRAKSEDER